MRPSNRQPSCVRFQPIVDADDGDTERPPRRSHAMRRRNPARRDGHEHEREERRCQKHEEPPRGAGCRGCSTPASTTPSGAEQQGEDGNGACARAVSRPARRRSGRQACGWILRATINRVSRPPLPKPSPSACLFVCLGNICRSPTAEAVFRHHLSHERPRRIVEVDSAGTGAWHVGDPPDERAQAEADRRGVPMESAARKVHVGDLEYFDLRHRDGRVEPRRPPRSGRHAASNEPSCGCSREFDPDAGEDLDVPDPYYGGPERLRGRVRPRRCVVPRIAANTFVTSSP